MGIQGEISMAPAVQRRRRFVALALLVLVGVTSASSEAWGDLSPTDLGAAPDGSEVELLQETKSFVTSSGKKKTLWTAKAAEKKIEHYANKAAKKLKQMNVIKEGKAKASAKVKKAAANRIVKGREKTIKSSQHWTNVAAKEEMKAYHMQKRMKRIYTRRARELKRRQGKLQVKMKAAFRKKLTNIEITAAGHMKHTKARTAQLKRKTAAAKIKEKKVEKQIATKKKKLKAASAKEVSHKKWAEKVKKKHKRVEAALARQKEGLAKQKKKEKVLKHEGAAKKKAKLKGSESKKKTLARLRKMKKKVDKKLHNFKKKVVPPAAEKGVKAKKVAAAKLKQEIKVKGAAKYSKKKKKGKKKKKKVIKMCGAVPCWLKKAVLKKAGSAKKLKALVKKAAVNISLHGKLSKKFHKKFSEKAVKDAKKLAKTGKVFKKGFKKAMSTKKPNHANMGNELQREAFRDVARDFGILPKKKEKKKKKVVVVPKV